MLVFVLKSKCSLDDVGVSIDGVGGRMKSSLDQPLLTCCLSGLCISQSAGRGESSHLLPSPHLENGASSSCFPCKSCHEIHIKMMKCTTNLRFCANVYYYCKLNPSLTMLSKNVSRQTPTPEESVSKEDFPTKEKNEAFIFFLFLSLETRF